MLRSISLSTLYLLSLLGLFSCHRNALYGSHANTIITSSTKSSTPVKFVRKSGPQLLNFEELTSLAENPKPEGRLAKKVEKLLSTPFIDNSAYFRSGMPEASFHPILGRSLRVSTWNIEKSIQTFAVAQALTSEKQFDEMLMPEIKEDPETYQETLQQRATLAASDVLLLQEMDLGHCRSDYLFAAKHLAQKLKMNFVYAPQQLEVDPTHLGLDHIQFGNKDTDPTACHSLSENRAKYKGVFGVAVLSRYPVKNVQLFQLKEQPYDWYEGEIQSPDLLESFRRKGAETVFHFKPVREVKVGGRAFTRVDLHVPDLPLQTLTIINVHLEIKTTPEARKKQVTEILSYIKDIKNPVVMAGDFNSSALDVRSTSFARFTRDITTNPTNILSAGLFAAEITGVSQVRAVVNGFKNFANPLAWDIPVLFPNKTRSLFNTMQNFRFSDGGSFDFRGNHSRSMHGYCGELSNSNQRSILRGFTFTYSLPRPIGLIGHERLDWIFVKSFLSAPKERRGSFRFAPHFGETLSLMNLSSTTPFSDHHPITTVLPFDEPRTAE